MDAVRSRNRQHGVGHCLVYVDMEAAGCWNSDACHSFTQRVNRVKVPSDPPLNPPHNFEESVMEVNSNGVLICP